MTTDAGELLKLADANHKDAEEFCRGAFGPLVIDVSQYVTIVAELMQHATDRALQAASQGSAAAAQAAPASPQEVQEACAQVADRAAERPLEVTPGVMARNIARGIRALIPPAAQASPDQHDATYLRGWNEGIERAVEALEKEGWYTPQETIRTLIETSPVPSAHPNTTPWDAHHNRSYEPVETRAKEIYDFFEYKDVGSKPAWVPGGNSLMQDEARICARNQLREAGHTPAHSSTDGESL